jgi:hypothetical protein
VNIAARGEAKRPKNNTPQGGTLLSMPSNTHNQALEVLSPDAFVEALHQSQNFERKQFAIAMAPIVAEVGSEAGFTQLGRAVCDRVLKGTGYNFRQVFFFFIAIFTLQKPRIFNLMFRSTQSEGQASVH